MNSSYHSNLVAAVKGREDIAPETLSEMVRTARAKAGGQATAQKRRECAHEAFSEGRCTKCGQKGPVSAMSELRYFVELGKDGLTDWMQIAPGPGKWNHPKWGSVVVTPETLREYADNFKAHIYQEHIPVDAEHKTKLSGALAYYRDMDARSDGLYAKLELTDRGKELLDSGGYKYFSPEFYDEWQDPATGTTHKNVITGGAFTTRPFFKDSSLKPIQLAELVEDEMPGKLCIAHSKPLCQMCEIGGADECESDGLVDAISGLVFDGLNDTDIDKGVRAALAYSRTMWELYGRNGGVQMSENGNGDSSGNAVHNSSTEGQMNDQNSTPGGDDLTKQFAEAQARNTVLETEVKTFAEQNKALTERVAAMEAEGRQRQFAEIVTGRGGANDGGPQWFGDANQHVKMLESLHTAFGPESDQFKAYVESQNAVAKAMAESAAMQPIGKTSAAPSVGSNVDGKLRAYAEKNSLSVEVATLRYFAEHPDEYVEWDREHTKSVGKGA